MSGRVVIGTAGHIDHGKTALVRALTGIDTDRLAEEKRRGITIDLGFAHLDLPDGSSAGVVDVPGHEDFVRNMVAGASGIDVALIVVAADEGVMPQTREHIAILRMLGVAHAVVALTKSDLVDADWLELARDELRAHLADTPYASAEMVHVSARTGVGLNDLRAALASAAGVAARAPQGELFRLPIDRAFTVHGTGTVVTGTVRDGSVAVGDTLRILPSGAAARIRGIQSHGAAVATAEAGARAALALTGLGREQAGRGSWAVVGAWPASSMLTVSLSVLGATGWEVRQRQRVRLHLGTAEVMARVVLLDRETLRAGQTGFAQLRLESPVVARHGDRFVIRSYSPVTTIGGGMVLEPAARKRRRGREHDAALLTALAASPADALPALVEAAGWDGLPLAELPVRLSALPPAAISHPALARVGDVLISRARVTAAVESLRASLESFHRAHPLRPGMEHADARRGVEAAGIGFADAVIDAAVAGGRIERRAGHLSLPGFVPVADPAQADARASLEAVWLHAGLAPPRLDELPADLAARKDLRDLVGLLEREGVLVPFLPDRLIHARVLIDARARLLDGLGGRTGLGPTEFRAVFDLPRRQLIPLLEQFDRLGWTRRDGDSRSVSGKDSPVSASPPS